MFKPQTELLSKGYKPEWSEGAATPPVFRTSTFVFKNCEEGKRAFEIAYGLRTPSVGEVPALIYSRVNNPNAEMVEDRVTVWDPVAPRNGGPIHAALFSSGMGAVSSSCLTFLRPGDEAIFTDPVYGGTEFFFRHLCPQFGITAKAVNAGCTEAEMEALVTPKTRVIYLETPANPTITLTDIKMAARVAEKHSTPEKRIVVIVDNTFLGPLFCQPHTLGADVVVFSATKFIGGHSDVVAGIATANAEYTKMIKGTRTIFGSNSEPDSAWLLLRSLPTLSIRMKTARDSCLQIVEFLEKHPSVDKVFYPGKPVMGADQLRIFQDQYSGSGSMITVLVKGGQKEAFTVLDNLHHMRLAVSLGGVESLAEHPATMTHSDMTPAEQAHAGITQNMVRFSIGLEDTGDLIHDLKHALDLILPK